MCGCEGDGIPEIVINNGNEEAYDERDSQLGLENQKKRKNISKISELNEWEHYSKPVAEHVLEVRR